MYSIRLPNFEGPFDLLLYFIKRDEINIYDIPIARVTEEFLSYIKVIKYFDLELAGEFILMASTLMYIKTSMLLPGPIDENGIEIDDPRTRLVERLLEYRRFKEAAAGLAAKADDSKYVYYRNLFAADDKLASDNADFKNATLFDLVNAFQAAIDRLNKKPVEHHVETIPATVEEQTAVIHSALSKKGRVKFSELIKNSTIHVIVATFLAILDMLKNGNIFIVQNEMFDEIEIAGHPAPN